MKMEDILSVRNEMGQRISRLREGFWAPYAEALNSVSDDEMVVDITIQCLENTRQHIARMDEDTKTGNISFINYGFDIIAAVIPNLIATEVASVQPMDRRVGEIFFLEFLYGSDKGRVTAGQKMFGARKAGNDPDELGTEEIYYSSETIPAEVGDTGDGATAAFTFTLAYTPVRPGELTLNAIDTGDNAMVITDDGNGALTGDTGAPGTIDYVTGDVDVTFAADVKNLEDVTATYKWNMEENPSMIPEVDLRITSEAVQAENRALKALYNVFSAYDLSQAFGRDMDTELQAALAAEIRKEVDGEILENMRLAQSTYDVEFTAAATQYVAQVEHDKAFANAVVQSANVIFQQTRRAAGNVLIVGTNVANIVEALGSNYFTPAGKPQVGPHYAGLFLNKFKVYKNPYYPVNEWVMAYKGETFMEAGYVYAPYMPFFMTQLGIREDLVGRKAAATSSAQKMVNTDFFTRGRLI